VCLPIIGAVVGIASSVAGAVGSHQQSQAQADYQNEVARRDYEHAIRRREAEWQQTLSIWGNKRVDFANQASENYSAADRAYATEQAKLNETFMQAAFQKQDMLSQLIQGRGSLAASGRAGKTAAKMDQSMISAFGRNNAIIAENLASARSAMIRRNEQTRYQLMSGNNQAWSNVSIAPSPGIAPPQPVMAPGPSGIGLVSGILGGVASGVNTWKGLQPPKAFDQVPKPPTNSFNFNTEATMPGISYQGIPNAPSFNKSLAIRPWSTDTYGVGHSGINTFGYSW
jgi:hypothetical protein